MTINRRILRSTTQRACTEHRCDNYEEFIFPGDLYNVTVEIHGTGKAKWLFVRKEHEHPACPYPDGDEDTSYEVLTYHIPFKIAA